MRQALEMALDWIQKQPEKTPESKYDVDTRYVVIREIEAALAQPEQEPVKLVSYNCKCGRTMNFESVHGVVAPQRKPLTDEEIMNIAKVSCSGISPHEDTLNFAKVIEAVHGIKE